MTSSLHLELLYRLCSEASLMHVDLKRKRARPMGTKGRFWSMRCSLSWRTPFGTARLSPRMATFGWLRTS